MSRKPKDEIPAGIAATDAEDAAADGLIEIAKAGESPLRIHPDAVPQHVALGWTVTE